MERKITQSSKWSTYIMRSVFLLTLFLTIPSLASSQFVPVYDATNGQIQTKILTDTTSIASSFTQYLQRFQQFSSAFNSFRTDFNDYRGEFRKAISDDTDSVRNLLSAGNPAGRAVQQCAARPGGRPARSPNGAFAAPFRNDSKGGVLGKVSPICVALYPAPSNAISSKSDMMLAICGWYLAVWSSLRLPWTFLLCGVKALTKWVSERLSYGLLPG